MFLSLVVLLLLLNLSVSSGAQQQDTWHLLNEGTFPFDSDGILAHPRGRRNAASWCTDDDELYVYGGKEGGARRSDMWRYEESTNRWIWLSDGPVPGLSGMAYWSTNSASELWMYGGRDDPGSVYDDLWKYDRATRVWSTQVTTGDLPGPRFGSIFWFDPSTDVLYLYGGKSNKTTIHQDLRGLNMRTLVWSIVSETNDPGAVDDGKGVVSPDTGIVYMFGGENLEDALRPNVLWSLDLKTFAWSSLGEGGPSAREDIVMWFDPSKNAFFIFGGKTDRQAFGEVWKYDISTTTWTETQGDENTPSPRWGTSICVDDEGYAFLFGGAALGQESMRNDVWKFGKVYTRPTIFDNMDRVSASAMLAAVMSTVTFLVCITMVCFLVHRIRKFAHI